jgi:hypothetical protein
MPRRQPGSDLEALRAQAIALDAKIKETAARERTKREAEDQRRRQIAGAAALEHMAAELDGPFAATMLSLINGRARSVADRALFNLPANPKETASPAAPIDGGHADENAKA